MQTMARESTKKLKEQKIKLADTADLAQCNTIMLDLTTSTTKNSSMKALHEQIVKSITTQQKTHFSNMTKYQVMYNEKESLRIEQITKQADTMKSSHSDLMSSSVKLTRLFGENNASFLEIADKKAPYKIFDSHGQFLATLNGRITRQKETTSLPPTLPAPAEAPAEAPAAPPLPRGLPGPPGAATAAAAAATAATAAAAVATAALAATAAAEVVATAVPAAKAAAAAATAAPAATGPPPPPPPPPRLPGPPGAAPAVAVAPAATATAVAGQKGGKRGTVINDG